MTVTKGPNRLVLDQYLDTAAEGRLRSAGLDWKKKAEDIKTLGDALGKAAKQAELRIGEQTLTGPAIRAGMEESSAAMVLKSEQLHAAGEALTQVATQISDARDQRDALANLGEKPPTYQAPPGTPGVEQTPEEIQAQADASQARQAERNAWQTEYDKQEARSRALTRDLDAAFLGAIPPMKEIHGEKDPTEPPPGSPSGPGGTYLPGTQAPPVTGGGGNGPGDRPQIRPAETGVVHLDNNNGNGNNNGTNVTPTNPTTTTPTHPITTTPTQPTITSPTLPTTVPTETTTVTGTQQSGVTYQPTGAQVSAPTSAPATAGVSPAALGAAGAAGGAGGMSGAIRPSTAPAGSAPARPIGSTARSAAPGALSRSASAPGSAAARSAGTAGSPASRGAAAGSTAGRGGAGSAGARGAAAGSTAGRGTGSAGRGAGSAGGRGAAAGSSTGSRSGGRGTGGARAAATGGAAGRGGRKGERDGAVSRDSLVYDQDWLGDDDIAPGVLD